MVKRGRVEDQEVFELFASLLRQTGSRAVDRLRLRRSSANISSSHANNSNNNNNNRDRRGDRAGTTGPSTPPPIDALVIQYCMHYLDLSHVLPSTHYLCAARDVVTACADRVLCPKSFVKIPLTVLCESLEAEYTAEAVQGMLTDVEEYVDLRRQLGEWISDRVGSGENVYDEDDDYGGYDDDEDGGGYGPGRRGGGGTYASSSYCGGGPMGDAESTLEVAGVLYGSLEYWVRVHSFVLALSLGAAKVRCYRLKPRYESELMGLLYSLGPKRTLAASTRERGGSTQGTSTGALKLETDTTSSGLAPLGVKKEPAGYEEEEGPMGVLAAAAGAIYNDGEGEEGEVKNVKVLQANSGIHGEEEDVVDVSAEEANRSRALAAAVLADTLALANCPVAPTEEGNAVSSSSAVTAAAGSAQSSTSSNVVIPAETLRKLQGIDPVFYTMIHARLGVLVARDRLQEFGTTACVAAPPPLTVQQQNILEQEKTKRAAAGGLAGFGEDDALGLPLDYVPDDTYFNKLLEQEDEVIDEDEVLYKDEVVDYYKRRPQQQQQLIKPHRFIRAKPGYTWTQYNRTHYDSRTNPPPKTIMWYEFTFLLPALANTKRDMRKVFRIENTPKGPADDYCLLVFSFGAPYADMAFRIVKKQWDTRRGGVRINFDKNGKYKLFFRFANSNYRR